MTPREAYLLRPRLLVLYSFSTPSRAGTSLRYLLVYRYMCFCSWALAFLFSYPSVASLQFKIASRRRQNLVWAQQVSVPASPGASAHDTQPLDLIPSSEESGVSSFDDTASYVHARNVHTVAYSSQGFLATAAADGSAIHIFQDTTHISGFFFSSFSLHSPKILCVHVRASNAEILLPPPPFFSPSSSFFSSPSDTGVPYRLACEILYPHSQPLSFLAFMDKSEMLVSSSLDGTAKVSWHVLSLTPLFMPCAISAFD